MIRIRQVKVSLQKEEIEIQQAVARKLHISISQIVRFEIHKESLDARHKENIQYVLEVDVEVDREEEVLAKNKSLDIFKAPIEKYQFPSKGSTSLSHPILVVGAGPAGFFASYLLAENGYPVIVIERGEPVEKRIETVQNFFENGILNENSNVQFGEGGAGTFSDGKLNTLTKDKFFRSRKVLETFVKHGAPKEILYESKPHIGTDLLRHVIVSMREEMKKRGVTFLYNTLLTDVHVEKNKLVGAIVNQTQKIPCESLILAIGHSARDTFEMLYQKKIEMEAKPFAVGLRIQHPQKMINKVQYGYETHPLLPPASYKLTFTSKSGRGVYSFCMCPGGEVVNASSEKGRLAINGMSLHARDMENANSAIVVTVTPKDFGMHPLSGLSFQRELEENAYQAGNGKIPIQLYGDFKENRKTKALGAVHPYFKGSYAFANLRSFLPTFITEALVEAIPYFDKKIRGFAREDAVIAAVESRTSSPLRILRDERLQSSIEGIYPCGEGSGYAGGIVTAAMDGIKVAEAIGSVYK